VGRASRSIPGPLEVKEGGINDLWTAACCLVHNLPLVTNNLSDFQTIAGEFSDLELVHPDL
jgi:predicted nucleic acid-binding protein